MTQPPPDRETPLACPRCGEVNLTTLDTGITGESGTTGIYIQPDGSIDPRWDGTVETSLDNAETVGVTCPSCQWNYQGRDWVTQLSKIEVTLATENDAATVRLAGDDTATVLIDGEAVVGVDAAGAVGTWPDGETWRPIDRRAQRKPISATVQGGRTSTVLTLEVNGASRAVQLLAAGSPAALSVNRSVVVRFERARPRGASAFPAGIRLDDGKPEAGAGPARPADFYRSRRASP
jgi:hypothetical protein